mmetsp:Transcript_81/g.175  ORF Transcript_81/g.175 Transcript_81/m.175 type:complete len:307 (-) Transcript_81:492-1412(-)
MGDQVCQAGFLNLHDLSRRVLIGQVIQVNNARHSGGNQPRQTEQSIHHVGETVQQEIPVVRVSMLEIVTGVVDQVPCDAVIKVKEDEGKRGRTGSGERGPRLSIQVAHLSEPRTSTNGFGLFRTFIRPERFARSVATSESRFEVIRNVEFSSLDVGESDLLDDGKQDHRTSDSKVVDHVAHILIAEVARVFEAAEKENGRGGTKSDDDTEQRRLVHAVIFISAREVLFEVFMRLVGRVQVTEKTTSSKGATHGVEDEDGDNQKGEDIIGKPSGQLDVSSEVHERSDGTVSECPNRDPGVKWEERNI